MRMSNIGQALGLFVLGCLPCLSHASAAPGADGFIQRADVVLAASKAAGAPLPTSDARVVALLAATTDQAVYGDAPVTGADLQKVLNVTAKGSEVMDLYMQDGRSQPPSVDEVIATNEKYQDLLAALLALAAHDGGRGIKAMTMRVASESASGRAADMATLGRIRLGIAHLFARLVHTPSARTGVSPANRAIILEAVVDEAPTVSAGLTLAERKDVFAVADDAARRGPPEERVTFARIAQAFGDSTCTGFCTYGH
ncbi:hypothetical protein KPL74_08000 [Bacillus sp. NP157]|nr:hypothetical protein KPL74_08000 [Bacillus sp. NP157]